MLGLDLSLTGTGVAHAGVATTIAPKKLTDVARMDYITDGIFDYLDKGVELVVMEGLAYGSVTGSAMERAGLWWRVKTFFVHERIAFAHVPPTVLKKYGTGKGNAGKDEVMIAVTRTFPDWEAKNNNEADAVVLANMGLAKLGLETPKLPKVQTDALEKVAWQ